MKRKLITLLFIILLMVGSAIPALAASQELPDTAGHWAQQDIEKAVAAGWVNGYPGGTFHPDAAITRAEFVKMLMSAIHLTPNSETSKFLIDNSSPIPFTDMDYHWLTTQGWTQPAQSCGLIVASDYSNNRFEPDKPITRYEIAVMVNRALGFVYPASQPVAEALPFSDKEQIPQWVEGYVKQAVNAGVLEGYPDGSFGGSRTATRAEAVVMVLRALQYMETGIDKDIKVFVKEDNIYSDAPPLEAGLTVPAQIIDGCIYVPVRSVFDAIAKLYDNTEFRYGWNPIDQILYFEYGMFFLDFRSGDNQYGYGNDGIGRNDAIGQYSPIFSAMAKSRMLYGELMIPVYSPNQANIGNMGMAVGAGSWSAETKTLVLPVGEVKWGE